MCNNRDIVLNFVIAGRDTTAILLSWFFYSISLSPDVERKVRRCLSHIYVLAPRMCASICFDVMAIVPRHVIWPECLVSSSYYVNGLRSSFVQVIEEVDKLEGRIPTWDELKGTKCKQPTATSVSFTCTPYNIPTHIHTHYWWNDNNSHR